MRTACIVAILLVLFSGVALAADGSAVITNINEEGQEVQTSPATWAWFAAGIGAGLVVFAAAFGIGKIGTASVEGIARQPEAAGDIRGSMIITAAMIEGVALFGVVVCLLAIVTLT